MAPIVHGLEAFYYEDMRFTYLDIDDPANRENKSKLGYRVQPHFFLLDEEGAILNQWVGPVSEEELVSAIELAR